MCPCCASKQRCQQLRYSGLLRFSYYVRKALGFLGVRCFGSAATSTYHHADCGSAIVLQTAVVHAYMDCCTALQGRRMLFTDKATMRRRQSNAVNSSATKKGDKPQSALLLLERRSAGLNQPAGALLRRDCVKHVIAGGQSRSLLGNVGCFDSPSLDCRPLLLSSPSPSAWVPLLCKQKHAGTSFACFR